jgi:hypothetical protein
MWESVLEWLSQPAAIAALRIVGVVFAAFLLTRLLKRGVRKVEGKVSEHTTPIRALQRTQTLAKVLSSAGIILIWSSPPSTSSPVWASISRHSSPA